MNRLLIYILLTILSYHVFFSFLINWLIFFIPAITGQIFNSFAALVTPIGIPSKEIKAEMETHPVIVETKIRKCSI